MKNIKGLIKYEILSLLRSKLMIVMIILYIFGIQQSFSSMFNDGTLKLGFAVFLKTSWLPLNLIMFPLFLIGIRIGTSNNEIFDVTNISYKNKITSKILSILIIDISIIIISSFIVILVAFFSKVSLGYFLNLFSLYLTNLCIFLAIASSVGLLLGLYVTKRIGEIPTYIICIFIFNILSNFYKEGKGILPLFRMDTFPSTFELFTHDKIQLNHNLFWIVIFVLFILAIYISNPNFKFSKKIFISIGMILCIIISSIIGHKINLNEPTFYNITSLEDTKSSEDTKSLEDTRTFYHLSNPGYHVSKYNMDMSLTDKITNKCSMNIVITDLDVDNLRFGLFEKMNVSKVKINNNETPFIRGKNYLDIPLTDKDLLTNNNLNVVIEYDGYINTTWFQGQNLFFLRENSMFLADVFEWYPKLNDKLEKEYDLKINYGGKNTIYSNLDKDYESNNNQLRFKGNDVEIFLISGNIVEVEYKDYTLIGNEEYFKTEEQLINTLELLESIRNSEQIDKPNVKKIIFSPDLPGKIFTEYKNAYLFTANDKLTFIFNK